MPKILLTNDDGIRSTGLVLAKRAAEKHGEVSIYAPKGQMTCTGGAITIGYPVYFEQAKVDGQTAFAVLGTPIDAVKLGLLGHKQNPDLVVSGINIGEQISAVAAFISGTFAAAFYSAVNGIPSLAVGYRPSSEDQKYDAHTGDDRGLKEGHRSVLEHIIAVVLKNGLQGADLWNVNLPTEPSDDIKVVPMIDCGYYEEGVTLEDSYFLNIGKVSDEPFDSETDAHHIGHSTVITPCRLNFTDRYALDRVRKLF